MTDLDKLRYALVKKFLQSSGHWTAEVERYLNESTFASQDDGEMGSFSVMHANKKVGKLDYAEAEYYDADDIKVVIALIGDEDGYPTDVDFWKVDSSKLIRFPTASALEISSK